MTEKQSFGSALAALVVAVPVGIYGGFVLTQLWGWFVVPLGVPAISLLHACGLSTLSGVVFGTRGIREGGNTWVTVITLAFVYSVCWGMGAIEHALMVRFA